MNAPRGSWTACLLRACSPAAAIAVATSLGGAWLTVRHGDVVAEARALGLRADASRLALAAQTIASGPWAAATGRRSVEVAGRSYLVSADGVRIEVEDRSGNRVGVDVLPGAPPRALSSPRSSTGDAALEDALVLGPEDWPQLTDAARGSAAGAGSCEGLRRDGDVGLRRFAVGTDRVDFVAGDALDLTQVERAVLKVAGNLWFESSCEVSLTRDLVLWVRGNLYVHGDVRVRGGGRLVVLTERPAGDVVFEDRDGSGGWSAGDRVRGGVAFAGAVEGGGGVWLGRPGGSGEVRVDAALLVEGQLHVCGDAVVHGPLALRCGVTRTAGARLLRDAAAEWAFPAGRARLRAFEPRGLPRPGPVEFLPR